MRTHYNIRNSTYSSTDEAVVANDGVSYFGTNQFITIRSRDINICTLISVYINTKEGEYRLKRITTLAYEIRIAPKNVKLLKNLRFKIINDNNTSLNFIIYCLNSITRENTRKHVILQHNHYLSNMDIVYFFGKCKYL